MAYAAADICASHCGVVSALLLVAVAVAVLQPAAATEAIAGDPEKALQTFSEAHAVDPLLREFQGFVAGFSKRYISEELEERFAAFKENLRRIRSHNVGNASFTLDLNEHADLTPEAFASVFLGRHRSLEQPSGEGLGDKLRAAEVLDEDALLHPMLGLLGRSSAQQLPESVDWVAKGALPPISNQGECGACWSFATTATLSAAWQIATGSLVVLSRQQLMDCSVPFGNHGCVGGTMDAAYAYARRVVLCTATSYPYIGDIGSCSQASCDAAIPKGGVLGYMPVPQFSETSLMKAVAKRPVAVGIEAEKQEAFQLYRSGVLSGACGTKPNHAVAVVGYGIERGLPYWYVRNSWGVTWGEAGYFKLRRGAGSPNVGECGILTMPSYPVVDSRLAQAGGHATLEGEPKAEGEGRKLADGVEEDDFLI